MEALPVTAHLAEYEEQALALSQSRTTGDWEPFDLEDAKLTVARWHNFLNWKALENLVNAMHSRVPGVYDFELAVEAVIAGSVEGLARMLRETPGLAFARSSRITGQDPAEHKATLLHYVAANGVETQNQKSPKNAVMIARTLLESGADPDALANMYGGEHTPLSMLVSSSPPAEAGVQLDLVDTLLQGGADPNGKGSGLWVNPTMTALAFGFTDAAERLVQRGAIVDRLALAAGLGRTAQARALLAAADPVERHRALALAAQLGRVDILRMLLDAGEDPDRYNPDGLHAHSTPLHQAALAGHEAVARLLVERGACLDLPDKVWRATPSGWATHAGWHELAGILRSTSKGTSRD